MEIKSNSQVYELIGFSCQVILVSKWMMQSRWRVIKFTAGKAAINKDKI